MKELIKYIYGSFFFFLFRFFPLQEKVVFSSYWGKKYDGNPKYISDELIKINGNIKQVWLNNSGKKFDMNPKIKDVKWGSIRMIYEMSTAKVWVDNHTKPCWIKKRKNQLYIETWHGGLGMKKVEFDMDENLSKEASKQIMHNSKIADLFISNSDFLTKIYRRAFCYKGPILECGFPRNDIFFDSKEKFYEIQKKVFKAFAIGEDKKIVLYAPTFREDENLNVYNIDFERLIKALKIKFKKDFIVLMRLHPRIKHLSKNIVGLNENVINASDYYDMQELIIASDIFITDYSSGIFDFALMYKPGFLYANDIEEYKKERGLYFELDSLPFPLAINNDQLEKNILEFNYSKYKIELKKYFDSMGLKEYGKAKEKIVSIIIDYINKKKLEIEKEIK